LEWVFLGFLFAVLIFVLIPLLPIENNYSLKMVTSGSMRPAIKTGGIVMVKPASSYSVGDIITFKIGPGKRDILTHRIIQQTGDNFITKGDANNVADTEPVNKGDILGKVVFDVPYAGYIANAIGSKMGICILVLLPALLIIISESRKIFSEIKKMRKKRRHKVKKTDVLGKNALTFLGFLTLSLMFLTLAFSQNTYAYFSDRAISTNQSFVAGHWVPVLDPIGDKSGTEGQMLQFTINATDPNGDILTYSADNLPSGAAFDAQTRTFSWRPSVGQAGTYTNVLFEVSDGRDSVSEDINILIAEAPLVQISNITIEDITTNSALILWQTSEPVASSVVEYGPEEGNYTDASDEPFWSAPNNYEIELEQLSAGTLYHFRVKIVDNLGRTVFSGDNTFATLPLGPGPG